jgi:hypothetical protein
MSFPSGRVGNANNLPAIKAPVARSFSLFRMAHEYPKLATIGYSHVSEAPHSFAFVCVLELRFPYESVAGIRVAEAKCGSRVFLKGQARHPNVPSTMG